MPSVWRTANCGTKKHPTNGEDFAVESQASPAPSYTFPMNVCRESRFRFSSVAHAAANSDETGSCEHPCSYVKNARTLLHCFADVRFAFNPREFVLQHNLRPGS